MLIELKLKKLSKNDIEWIKELSTPLIKLREFKLIERNEEILPNNKDTYDTEKEILLVIFTQNTDYRYLLIESGGIYYCGHDVNVYGLTCVYVGRPEGRLPLVTTNYLTKCYSSEIYQLTDAAKLYLEMGA